MHVAITIALTGLAIVFALSSIASAEHLGDSIGVRRG